MGRGQHKEDQVNAWRGCGPQGLATPANCESAKWTRFFYKRMHKPTGQANHWSVLRVRGQGSTVDDLHSGFGLPFGVAAVHGAVGQDAQYFLNGGDALGDFGDRGHSEGIKANLAKIVM